MEEIRKGHDCYEYHEHEGADECNDMKGIFLAFSPG